jgi:Protein of unknown function (DUF2683)
MVQATIYLTDKANHILTVVKAVNRLKDKSEAVEYIAERYAEFFPDLFKEMPAEKKEVTICKYN